jgi:hypothetical protein
MAIAVMINVQFVREPVCCHTAGAADAPDVDVARDDEATEDVLETKHLGFVTY